MAHTSTSSRLRCQGAAKGHKSQIISVVKSYLPPFERHSSATPVPPSISTFIKSGSEPSTHFSTRHYSYINQSCASAVAHIKVFHYPIYRFTLQLFLMKKGKGGHLGRVQAFKSCRTGYVTEVTGVKKITIFFLQKLVVASGNVNPALWETIFPNRSFTRTMTEESHFRVRPRLHK